MPFETIPCCEFQANKTTRENDPDNFREGNSAVRAMAEEAGKLKIKFKSTLKRPVYNLILQLSFGMYADCIFSSPHYQIKLLWNTRNLQTRNDVKENNWSWHITMYVKIQLSSKHLPFCLIISSFSFNFTLSAIHVICYRNARICMKKLCTCVVYL